MDNIVEKITLYDILGYLFPGCILMMMILVSYKKWTEEMLEKLGDNMGMLYFAFFLVSYLAGIAISETAAIVLAVFKKIIFAIGKRMEEKENKFGENELIFALKKSGIKDDDNTIRNNIQNKSKNVYMKYMYGIVQSCPEYKRIHNYKSACVMYKNLAFVLLIGDIVMCWNHAANNVIYVGNFVISVILIVRYYRFLKKIDDYTITWFIDKYADLS